MGDDPVVQRFDKLIAITQLVHREAIDRERERISSDATYRAILERTSDWVPAGKLQTAVMKETQQSRPTVKRRIADLVAQGLLAKQGAGGNVSYRATGLV